MNYTPIRIEATDSRMFSAEAFAELVGTSVMLGDDDTEATLTGADIEPDGSAVTLTVETVEDISGLEEPIPVRLLTPVEVHAAA